MMYHCRAKFETYVSMYGDIALDVVDPKYRNALEKELEEIAKDKAKKAGKIKPKAKPGTKPKKKKLFPVKPDYTSAELSAYLPQGVAGCCLTVEVEWHNRVKVSYPRDFPPWSVSMSFGTGGVDQWTAASYCLVWAWREHMEATGASCPWELPELEEK